MHAAQRLPKGKVECTQATLTILLIGRVLIGLARLRCVIEPKRVRIAAGVPCRVYQRALLRNQQQEHT